MTRTEWDRARVEQYAGRTKQSLADARYYLHRLYTQQGGLDLAAVDAVVDPVVDEAYQSHNRPVSPSN